MKEVASILAGTLVETVDLSGTKLMAMLVHYRLLDSLILEYFASANGLADSCALALVNMFKHCPELKMFKANDNKFTENILTLVSKAVQGHGHLEHIRCTYVSAVTADIAS